MPTVTRRGSDSHSAFEDLSAPKEPKEYESCSKREPAIGLAGEGGRCYRPKLLDQYTSVYTVINV
jgi:hypothetical protein